MKTVYEVWQRPSKSGRYTNVDSFATLEEAKQAVGPEALSWKTIENRFIPVPDPNDAFISEKPSPETTEDRVRLSLDLIRGFGGIDGDHHKAWVLDQVTRTLLGDEYEEFVRDAKAGEDGPDTYSWDEGIAP